VSTAISVLGGIGLFLLGMTVMTDALKALAGSSLRAVLSAATTTPISGAIWGAVITLLVQSSSATTMTTIGLVSAGLLTFPQGLGLVFGANVGTTATGWLVALIGVRVSLTAAALPMIFIGALTNLLGRGRVSTTGAALAGFALVLFGLTTLQQGMAGVAEQWHPADLPAVMADPGSGWWSAIFGVLTLVVVGIVVTTLMQSSTAAIAVTLSANYAGAIGLDQACALIIGQNIGTATSSAMAAIGASNAAKRLALAYILFKLIAAIIALVAFPVVTPLLVRASSSVDAVTLLAGYHTAYNVVGVAVLLPLIDWFARLVERILPARGSPLTQCLDPAALANPIVAVEAVRRTIARALAVVCESLAPALAAASRRQERAPEKAVDTVEHAAEALRQAQEFMSRMNGPPESEEEQERLTSTLHALDHASRLAETAREAREFKELANAPDDMRAAALCDDAMRYATIVAKEVAGIAAGSFHAAAIEPSRKTPASSDTNPAPEQPAISTDDAFLRLEHCAKSLAQLRSNHRATTLNAVASGALTASEAIISVDGVRRLEALAHHAWRSAAHLLGRAGQNRTPL
jgi:phosphate:Na+ symporter